VNYKHFLPCRNQRTKNCKNRRQIFKFVGQ
jgi:hypothetical protein